MAFDPVTGPAALINLSGLMGNAMAIAGNVPQLAAADAANTNSGGLINDACDYLISIEGPLPNATLIATARTVAARFIKGLLWDIGNFPRLWSLADGSPVAALGYATAGVVGVTDWLTALATAGGTYSNARRGLLDRFWGRLVLAGIDARLEYLLLFAGENAQQALFGWKRKISSLAVNSPLFTPNVGFTGDSISAYIDTLFDPVANRTVILDTDCCHGAFVVGPNVVSNTNVQGVQTTGSRALLLRPRSNVTPGGQFVGRAMCATDMLGPLTTTPIGLWAVSRRPGPIFELWRDGKLAGTVAPATTAGLPGFKMGVLAFNNSGTFANFSPYQVALSFAGLSLSAAQHGELAAALADHLVAIRS